ncbi:MAG: B12-binding domain-containing radical SAM protein [Nitrospirae bacterium]|nr:B12-binding domain-containing radical SAM protein [Nitrospirota bacterium]
MKNNFKSVLLLKLPYCAHPDALEKDHDFRTHAPFRPIPSLALASLCAFIDKYKKLAYSLKAVDINIEAYREPDIPIDIMDYSGLLIECIRNNEYDVLALSAMFVYNVRWVDMAVSLSRKYHPNAKIIIGGGYPTLFPERCLNEHDIDDAVIGEGETTLLHILNRYNDYDDDEFSRQFPFESYASKNEAGEITLSEKKSYFLDLANLPMPSWGYLNIEEYLRKSGMNILPMEGSRGCPYNCAFCCTFLSWGRRVRYKPVKHLIEEICEIYKRYKTMLHFVDDNLSFSKEWVTEFLNNFIDLKLPMILQASNFSVKRLDEDIIDLLIKAGMDEFSIAVESGSPEIQKLVRKNIDFDQVRKIVNLIKSKNKLVHINWMIGFPNETIAQINATFNLAQELRAYHNQFLVVLPYPGTELFEYAKSQDLLIFKEDDLDKFDMRKCDYLKSEEWNYNQLQEMIYDKNIELNFLNNPLMDSVEGREHLRQYYENFLIRLPEHIIAHIVLGYIYRQNNFHIEFAKHYDAASGLFMDKALRTTFMRYLSWDHRIIDDFKQYVADKNIVI